MLGQMLMLMLLLMLNKCFWYYKMSFLIVSGDPEKKKCPFFESVNNYPVCF